jgi:uncharacterized protein (TIGR03437 family)
MRICQTASFVLTATGLLASLLALSGAAQAQFAPGSPFPAGGGPSSIAVGDFNNDGIPDLAVADFTAGMVTVLLGNGAGGFAPLPNSMPIPVGVEPASIVAGFFNNDANLDLAVANQGSGTITILLGNGKGTFVQHGTPIGVESEPIYITVVKLGSSIGLAVANFGNKTVTVMVDDGMANFKQVPHSPFPVGNYPCSVAVGDFNGDGLQDLAVVNKGDGTVSVLLGSTDQSFVAAPGPPVVVNPQTNPGAPASSPISITAADFNQDGNLDLAVADEGQNSVAILLGNGMGGFAAAPGTVPIPLGSEPFYIKEANFNDDTYPDLAVVNSGANSVTVLLGNGTGGFTPAAGSPFAGGSGSTFLAVQDFNGDGKPDLAVANQSSNTVTVLLNEDYLPVTVGSASYVQPVAPGSLASIFGSALVPAKTGVEATVVPLPNILNGASVIITDSLGIQSLLPLLYAGPTQINVFIPSTTNTGQATLTVFNASGSQSSQANITPVAPALFSADGTGHGVAAAQFVAYPFQNVIDVFSCTTVTGACVPVPITISPNSQLVLFGTGIRNARSVTVNIGNESGLVPAYAGQAPENFGEDQVNVPLPIKLAHSGLVEVSVTVGFAASQTMSSNHVTIFIE